MTVPIGVLGGIFDPVHFGHLATAALARDFFHLEKIIFIPAGVPPHKRATVAASPVHRLAMVRLALHNEAGAIIWDREITSTGVSYTVDTLAALHESFRGAPLFFIVGADNLHEIYTWHRYREILEMATLCVAHRPGYSMEIPETLAGARIEPFPSPSWGLSSTQLRGYLSSGYTCTHLLPDTVREYISVNGLYRTCEEPAGKVQCRQVH
jgi:nicotinate-nucleotide adenylyltransferase